MFCPFCGTDNAVDKKYCRSCGAVLPAGAKASAKLRPAQPNQNAPSTPPSTFVPPQPPDLPTIAKTQQPNAVKSPQRPATLAPDDPFNTNPTFAAPPKPGTAPPIASTIDFHEE